MDQHSNSDEDLPDLDELYAAAANKWLRETEEVIAEVRRERAAEGGSRPHLISVDELRAAGALDVPPAWRKSLRVERDLFSGLFREEDFDRGEADSTSREPDDTQAADELDSRANSPDGVWRIASAGESPERADGV